MIADFYLRQSCWELVQPYLTEKRGPYTAKLGRVKELGFELVLRGPLSAFREPEGALAEILQHVITNHRRTRDDDEDQVWLYFERYFDAADIEHLIGKKAARRAIAEMEEEEDGLTKGESSAVFETGQGYLEFTKMQGLPYFRIKLMAYRIDFKKVLKPTGRYLRLLEKCAGEPKTL